MNMEKELLVQLMELHGVKERACAKHLINQMRPNTTIGSCKYCETIAKVLAEHPEYEQVRLP